ncbi:hypothetical protein [Dialister sp.]|nr:hypothetical protein [Dialister sp.]
MYDAEARAYQVQQEMYKRQNAYMSEASLGVYAFFAGYRNGGYKEISVCL